MTNALLMIQLNGADRVEAVWKVNWMVHRPLLETLAVANELDAYEPLRLVLKGSTCASCRCA